MKTNGLGSLATLLITSAMISDAPPAEACGGYFVPPSEATVVTDHRMALSIGPQQTILWDQIRYDGDPKEFAWVLPVRSGAKIEVANDELFTALDASTQPIVYAPQRDGQPAGCALTGCAAEDNSVNAESANGGNVQIISQSVIGPYEQVTLRSTDEGSLTSWLRKNEFAIPQTIEPTIAAYIKEGFDFIALRLRPTCGERAMRPVRVISPGATPSLPLRMVAAGVGSKVGLILYVITEGRYQPQNFPHAVIDDADLRWDRDTNKSNYEPMSQAIMARADGRTWLTEYADKPSIPLVGTGWVQPSAPVYSFDGLRRRTTKLGDLYYGLCKEWTGSSSTYNPYRPTGSSSSSSGSVNYTPCPDTTLDAGYTQSPPVKDAGHDAGHDAGSADAGDAGDDPSGQGDDDDPTQTPTPPTNTPGGYTGNPKKDCAYLDDLDEALEGLHREDVWVTRLRSVLPSSALSEGDLAVEPAKLTDGRADTTTVSNLHWTPYYSDEAAPESTKGNCAGSPHQRRPYTAWAIVICAGAVAATWLRRHRRTR